MFFVNRKVSNYGNILNVPQWVVILGPDGIDNWRTKWIRQSFFGTPVR